MSNGQLIALAATQLVLALYGAGLRRPFGSLVTLNFLPMHWRFATWRVVLADWVFVVFIVSMWVLLLVQGPVVPLLIVGFCLWPVVESLSRKIAIVPSYFLSLGFAAIAISTITFDILMN